MQPKRLYRSATNRVVAGVCGGIAEYFNIDPVIVRLLYACFLLSSFGTAILIYIIAAVIVPHQPKMLTAETGKS